MFGLKLKKTIVVSVAILVPSSFMSTNVHAAKITAPAAPTFVLVKSQEVKAKTHHITVMLEKPVKTGGSKITSMTVQILGKKCTIRGNARSCTIRNLTVARNSAPRIFATAANKKGASKRAWINYSPSGRIWLAAGYTPQGQRFPSAVTKVQNSRVLTGNSTKWKKFQAINRSSVSSASASKQAVPTVGNPTVIFNITGTVGIALPENASSAPQSGMFAVRTDGTTVDSLMAGSLVASVRDFYSAPNGRFYVAFTSRTALEQGGPLCALGEVNSSTGVTTCVDTSIENVALTLMNSDSAPIQFDAQGSIYYTGRANSKFVLRKSVNGTVSNIINDNMTLGAFIVLPDGSVVMRGATTSPFTQWLRKLSPTGELANLVNQGSQVTFLSKFPDGNVYFGVSSDGVSNDSIRRYLTSSQSVDPMDWLNRASWTGTTARYVLPQCNQAKGSSSNTSYLSAVCMMPSSIYKIYTTTDARVFGLVAMGSATNELISLYPTPEVVNTVLKKISVVYQVGTKLVLAGTNAAGTNMLTVYEPSTYQETIIVDQSNETEVYSIAYVAQTGKILFNGLRFSNNSLVVGEVDLP